MVLDQFSLAGQVGIVTGGGRGLGKMFCQVFAEAGADIVVAEIDSLTGEQTAGEVRSLGRKARFIQTDVRQRKSIFDMVSSAVAEFGKIDFMVNNAGIAKWVEAEKMDEADWKEMMDVNLNGVFYGCQAAALHMIPRRNGRIINIASMSGLIVNKPQPQAAYNTSKAAVIHLTKSLAVEWAQYNIRVNAIAPGYMNTPMTVKFFNDPHFGGVWNEATPMKRPGEPSELGPAAVFLASNASSFITGETIVIDGGYTAW